MVALGMWHLVGFWTTWFVHLSREKYMHIVLIEEKRKERKREPGGRERGRERERERERKRFLWVGKGHRACVQVGYFFMLYL